MGSGLALHDGRSPLGVQQKDVPTVMTQKTYPYTTWRLLPSFRPTQVVIKGQYPNHPEWLLTDTGRILGVSEVFDTHADAIAAGRAKLVVMSDKYRAMGVSIQKKTQVLDAAEKGGAA